MTRKSIEKVRRKQITRKPRKLTRYNVWGLETAPNENGPYVLYDYVQAECRKLGYESIEELGDGYMAVYNKLETVRDDMLAVVEALRNLHDFAAKWTPDHVYEPGVPKALWDACEILEQWDKQHALSQGEEEGR